MPIMSKAGIDIVLTPPDHGHLSVHGPKGRRAQAERKAKKQHAPT